MRHVTAISGVSMSKKRDEAEGAAGVPSSGPRSAGAVMSASAPAQGAQDACKDGERRAEPRCDVCLTVTLFGDHESYLGLSENLSLDGVFVRTQNILPVGSMMRLEFSLPTSTVPLSIAGEVRWIRSPDTDHPEPDSPGSAGDGSAKPGMGVQFKQVTRETARAIGRFMKHRRTALGGG